MSPIGKSCKRYNIPGDAHELTFSTYGRQPLLDNDRIRLQLATAVTKAKEKHGFHLWAWVFMLDHVHLLIWPTSVPYSIGDILKSIKQPVGRLEVTRAKKLDPERLSLMSTGLETTRYRLWQEGGGYDRNLASKDEIDNSVKYIHNNPVTAKLVGTPDQWLWSSFREWHNLDHIGLSIDRDSFPVS
jgi:putative transposase